MSILASLPRPASGRAHDPFASDIDFGMLTQQAQQRLDYLSDPSLIDAPSTAEWRKERLVAEKIRSMKRAARFHEARDAHHHETHRRRIGLADAEAHAQAAAEQHRLISPAVRIGRLYRGSRSTTRILSSVLVAGVVWGAANVQHNMMAGVPITEPRWWLAFAIEPMITLPLIAVMQLQTTASREGRVTSEKKKKFVLIEAALLMLTLALNIGPHIGAGNLWTLLMYGVAPTMIASAVALHAFASAEYAEMIADSPVLQTSVDSETSDSPSKVATLAA